MIFILLKPRLQAAVLMENCGNAIKQLSQIDLNCTLFAVFIVTKSF